jgi:predicted ATP-grasp superfamily ATP-dependent carboligase
VYFAEVKVLIFEFITGGGFTGSDLPASLAREGSLMLNALLNDFAALPEHDVFVMLDYRFAKTYDENVGWARFFAHLSDYKNIHLIPINPTDNVFAIFNKSLKECDAAWIVAPETDDILLKFTQQVEKANKLLLSVPSSAIIKTADKLQTFNILTANNIPTIPTQRLLDLPGFKNLEGLPLVIKPIDGVGCENNFVIQNQIEFNQVIQKIEQPQNYITQPFIKGDALSVSGIFKHGQTQLLCINRQHLEIKNQQFKLLGCEVNIPINKAMFENLLHEIANALPDLFGYVGIDLILANQHLYIVEINPRLTSSYAGIQQALGINVAELVLQSINVETTINLTNNQTIYIDTVQE